MESEDDSYNGERSTSHIPGVGIKKIDVQGNRRKSLYVQFEAANELDNLPVLGYWKMRGLAQPIRFLLAYLKVNYKEQVYEQGDAPDFSTKQWTSVKDNLGLDFPNMPYFIDGEVRLTEPLAIMKYIAAQYAPESVRGASLGDKGDVEMLAHILLDLMKQASLPCYLKETV